MEFCDATCTERWHHETDNEDDGHKGATTPLGWTGDGGRFHGGSRLWRQAFPGAWARPLGSAFHRGLCGFRAPGLAGSSRFAPRCVQSPPRCWTTSGRGGASYSCCPAAAAAATAAAGGQAQEPWNLQLGDGRDPWPARRQHPIRPSMVLPGVRDRSCRCGLQLVGAAGAGAQAPILPTVIGARGPPGVVRGRGRARSQRAPNSSILFRLHRRPRLRRRRLSPYYFVLAPRLALLPLLVCVRPSAIRGAASKGPAQPRHTRGQLPLVFSGSPGVSLDPFLLPPFPVSFSPELRRHHFIGHRRLQPSSRGEASWSYQVTTCLCDAVRATQNPSIQPAAPVNPFPLAGARAHAWVATHPPRRAKLTHLPPSGPAVVAFWAVSWSPPPQPATIAINRLGGHRILPTNSTLTSPSRTSGPPPASLCRAVAHVPDQRPSPTTPSWRTVSLRLRVQDRRVRRRIPPRASPRGSRPTASSLPCGGIISNGRRIVPPGRRYSAQCLSMGWTRPRSWKHTRRLHPSREDGMECNPHCAAETSASPYN